MPLKFRVIALATFGVVASAAVSEGRDNGQYAGVSKDIKVWIEALTDAAGIGCCATADGFRPKEVQWDIASSFYRVKVGSQWLNVPDKAVIRGPNRLGYAVAWLEYDWDINSGEITPTVRCFLPGPAS
jgi:hypothetical protein